MITDSLTLQWNAFQSLKPIGGVSVARAPGPARVIRTVLVATIRARFPRPASMMVSRARKVPARAYTCRIVAAGRLPWLRRRSPKSSV